MLEALNTMFEYELKYDDCDSNILIPAEAGPEFLNASALSGVRGFLTDAIVWFSDFRISKSALHKAVGRAVPQ